MHEVVFVAGHVVDECLHFIHRKKMARNVQHQPSPAEPRTVCNVYCRDRPADVFDNLFAFNFFWHQLQQGLQAIKKPCRFWGKNADVFCGYGKSISFIAKRLLWRKQKMNTLFSWCVFNVQGKSCSFFQLNIEHCCHFHCFGIICSNHNGSGGINGKCACSLTQDCGLWDDGNAFVL